MTAPLSRRLRGILALDDFEQAARRHLPRPIFGYVAGNAETGASQRDNRLALDQIGFLPRVLNNVSQRSLKARLLGTDWSAPFGIAPMGVSALTAYRGDIVLAQSAAQAGIPMIMSGSSLTRMEEVAQAAPQTWFQAYLPPTMDRTRALVDRVARAGFGTLVITADSAVRGNPENYSRAGFTSPLRPSLSLVWQGLTHPRWTFGTFLRTIARSGIPHFENNDTEKRTPIVARSVVRDFSGRAHLDWAAMANIRDQWRGCMVLKGILHPDDARRARELGMDGVILSNHGGRQLDGAVSPLRVLSEARAAVGDMPLLIDSGFRRGSDVLKALALGADFVFIGRPFNYAATIAGFAGVMHAIDLLQREIDADMGLLGINSLDELGQQHLRCLGSVLRAQHPQATSVF